MGIFSKRRYVIVNVESKEDVYESKELIPKEVVLEDIESENLEPALYRLEERVNGRKIRNAWVMRKARKQKTPEELAEQSREEAEKFIQQDAADIRERVDKHNKFKQTVKETYGIEGGSAIDKIEIPTGKDGKLGIIEAANLAIAQSTYEGIRETKPQEVSAAFKSVMDSGTTILAGISQMFADRIVDASKRNKRKEKTSEKKEEVDPDKKKETPKKVLETHKEDLGAGKTRTTFGSEQDTSSSQPENTTSSLDDSDDLYAQYKEDMLGSEER